MPRARASESAAKVLRALTLLADQTVKDKLYVLGVGEVDRLLKIPMQEFKDIGLSKTEVQMLTERAHKVVSGGTRAQRVQRRMVNAMLADPSSPKRQKRPQQLAQELQGMFFAAAGDRETIMAEELFSSVREAGVPLSEEDEKLLAAYLAERAEANGVQDWRGTLTVDDCLDLFWLTPLNDGDVRLDMPAIPDPASPSSPGSSSSADVTSPARGAGSIYKPVSVKGREWESFVPSSSQLDSFSNFATGSWLPPRAGGAGGEGALLDDDRLCVFVESCSAIRGHSKSLRGSHNRYDDLSHEVMAAIEGLRVQPPPCAVINPGIGALLVTAVRRGGERWARQHAEHLRKTEWMNSRYPRYGAMEVWAFFPNEVVPLCLFSKLEEKRFPSTDEIVSRVVDHLGTKFEDCAPPGVLYMPPSIPPQRCDNCRKGKVLNGRCSWCAATMPKELMASKSSHSGPSFSRPLRRSAQASQRP